jgi:hypothetical protein
MKWLKRLSHRFWVWAWRKLDSHRLVEEMSTPFEITVKPGTSLPLTPEETKERDLRLQEALGELTDSELLNRASAEGFQNIYYRGEKLQPDTSAKDGVMYVKEDGENFMIFNSKDLDTSGAIKKGYDHNS